MPFERGTGDPGTAAALEIGRREAATRRLRAVLIVAGAAVLLPALAVPTSAGARSQPRAGSTSVPSNHRINPTPAEPAAPYTDNFTRNFRLDPTIARDPVSGAYIAGSMDYRDEQQCIQTGTGTLGTTQYTSGYCQPSWWHTGIAGVYLSQDAAHWTQLAAHDGATSDSGASCTAASHTLPGYCAAGLVPGYDGEVAFGPKPAASGTGFGWGQGARAYYANLPLQLHSGIPNPAVAVSRSDDDGSHWMAPVVLPGTTPRSVVNDKEAIWVDANSSSPCFGDAYLAWDLSVDNGNSYQVAFSRSVDGGSTWSSWITLLPAATALDPGPAIQSLPDGTVVVSYEDAVSAVPYMKDSVLTGCGQVAGQPVTIATFGNTPAVFPGSLFPVWDFPSTASDSAGRLYMTWVDWTGANQSVVRFSKSSDGGQTWSAPVGVSSGAGNAALPAIGVTPDGATTFIEFQSETVQSQTPGAGSALIQALYARSADGGQTWTQQALSPGGADADGTASPQLNLQRIGDYTAVVVTTVNGVPSAVPVWTDVRNSVPCPLVDAYRSALRNGQSAARPDPDVNQQCPVGFGRTDIYDAVVPLN